MARLAFVGKESIDRILAADGDPDALLALIADVCRLNALVAVKRAGSGHLGSSFSSLDVVAHLLYSELNLVEVGFDDPGRDVFFSSKGHDVPGLYAALYGLGVVPADRLARLRRLGGLDGHPDVGVPGIEANSGSLGMGISKGRGIAWAKRRAGRGGLAVVMTGDGELQEGQNWEALQSAAHDRLGGLWIVVDRNELQSDKPTEEILALGDLESKLRAFGWQVETCDGHDHAALRAVFARFRAGGDAPKALVADTIKGKGVSFMEHPAALAADGGTYRWHAGAPGDEPFEQARAELAARIEDGFAAFGLAPPSYVELRALDDARGLEGEPESGAGARKRGSPTSTSSTPTARSSSSSRRATRASSSSTPTSRPTAACARSSWPIPERFLECGIAEQDMVSTAAGLARHGFLPVVNSFASFLASRANEQIYNQASERTKVVYALHYAGLIPAGPGKSHQSIRDVSLLAALPGMTVVQPANAEETRAARALGRRGGRDHGRDPARHRAVAASHRPGRRTRARARARPEGGLGRRALRVRAGDAQRGPHRVRAARGGRPLGRRREPAVAQRGRHGLARRDRGAGANTCSCSRTTRRSVRSATRCGVSWTSAPSPCSVSKAGPRAGRRPRRCATTGSTARRSRSGSRR